MKVAIDTSPLKNSNAIRGVGVYTRLLVSELQKIQSKDFALTDDIQSADIVHYPFFDFFFPTLPFNFLNQQKRIVTIHDVIPMLYPDNYRPGIKGMLNFYRQKLALQSVQTIITDSFASKAGIIKYLNVPEKKVSVVYLAGNPEITKVEKSKQASVRKKYDLPDKFLLYVGDINYNKNIPALIKAVHYLPKELSLVCVGKNFKRQNIPEWQAIELEFDEVKDRVIFITDVQKDDSAELAAIYSGAEAYVQPSLFEGFGLPILEAMQAETLVVATKNSSLIEVGGKVAEFVHPNAESIADGIKKVLALSSDEKRKRKQEGLKWSKQFSWQATAQATLQIYQNVFDRESL